MSSMFQRVPQSAEGGDGADMSHANSASMTKEKREEK